MDKSFDIVQPVRSVIFVLKYAGLWCADLSYWQTFMYYLYALSLHFIMSITFLVLQYINLLNMNNLKEITEGLYLTLTKTGMMVKLVNILYNAPQIMSLIDDLQNNQFKLRTTKEYEVVRKAHKNFNRFKYFYLWLAYACIVVPFLTPIITESYKLPYPAWFPFDVKINNNYWYAWCYELLALCITCPINVSCDLMNTFLMLQTGMYYELIGMRLEKVGYQDKDLTKSPIEFEKIVLKDFSEHIKANQICNLIARRAETFISIPVFVQNSLSTLVLCVSVFQLQDCSPITDPGDFILFTYFSVAVIIQIYLPCFYGNKITEKSNNLTNCIYNSNWINLSIKCRKMVFTYMEMVKTPMTIKAGQVLIIGFETFTKTMNNAYNFFTALKTMKK